MCEEVETMSFRVRILKGGEFQVSSKSMISFGNRDLNGEVVVVGEVMRRKNDVVKRFRRKVCPRCHGDGKIPGC